jgi:acyl-CoA reductase-like NAD-dependent aldehyde dehydrogenase
MTTRPFDKLLRWMTMTEPQYRSDDLEDVAELLRRAAEYATDHDDDIVAAELRDGAAVVESEVQR